MTSYERDEDGDLFMGDFLFQETDTFTMSLLDFDSDNTLLTPAELSIAQEQQSLSSESFQPTSPVSTDDGSTDAEVSTPPPAFVQQQTQQQQQQHFQTSPASRLPLLSSSASMNSPLPSEQKLLAPRSSSNSSSNFNNSNNNTGIPIAANLSPANTVKSVQSNPMQTSPSFLGGLPYAMPVAYFPPSLNVTQNQLLSHFRPRVPDARSSSAAATATSDPNSNKSKREIRQMKNRESANKSRLRRKTQLTTLTTEVTELKKKEQELHTLIAGLRAENKSLLDQNTFLRSLATSFKHEQSSSISNHQMAAFTSLPSPMEQQNCVALNMLESGQKMDMDGEADVDLVTLGRPGKRRAVSSALSTASLAVCASVFGITVFTDYDSGGVDSGKIRGVGRVLHEAPTACGMEGCSIEDSSSMVGLAMTAMRSWWQFVSSSELVFGVLLNVLSFIAIVAVYQLWQSHSAAMWPWKMSMATAPKDRGVRYQAKSIESSSAVGIEKKQNAAGG